VASVKKQDIPSLPEIFRKSDRTAADCTEFYVWEMITDIKDLAITSRHFGLLARLLSAVEKGFIIKL
jgi:hypothetical protein